MQLLEIAMEPAKQHRVERLPKSFPVGSVYVVEGSGGELGRLRVSSRYLLTPEGQRIELPVELGTGFARALPRRVRDGRLNGHGGEAGKNILHWQKNLRSSRNHR
jgi:hypothetical protein